MPLIGVYCEDESHYGQPHSFTEYLELLKNEECVTHSPIELVVAMSRNSEERKDAGYSATTLLDCPRKIILASEHDYYEFPSKYYARFRGTIGHFMMEAYAEDDPDVVRELRVSKTITVRGRTFVLTGKFDKYNKRTKLLTDYKTIESVPYDGPKEKHPPQLNIYQWLLWGGTIMETGEQIFWPVERMGIQYLDMSEPLKVKADVWDLVEVEQYIHDALVPFVVYQETGQLPPILKNADGRRHPFCKSCALREPCDLRKKNGI